MFSWVPTQADSCVNERITLLSRARAVSSAAGLWKLFRYQAERYSAIGLKLFGFIAESLFTIIPESRSPCPGFPKMLKPR